MRICVYAFGDCSGLTSVTIPDSVLSISGNPFTNSRLTHIDVDSENPAFESIDGVLFDKQRKALISYPGARAGTYTIPEGTLLIDDLAFDSCGGLTAVTIPDSVTSIGSGSFIINPFVDCPLLYIDVGPDNPTFESADGGLFDKQRKVLIAYPSAREGSYTVPEETLLIGDYAFYRCGGLTSVTIPDSVTDIGDSAFRECAGLTSATIGDSVTRIGMGAFEGCSGLTSVAIPDSVRHIGFWAFEGCSGLTAVTIPASVMSIGSGAFNGCMGLTGITIPASVMDIWRNPFAGSSLTHIDVESGNPVFESINGVLFDKKQRKQLVSYPSGREGAYMIPEGVQAIGKGAFERCDGLTAVTIPDSVKAIDYEAFKDCASLTEVNIPDSLRGISLNAFDGCIGLTGMTIPDSVTYIGSGAFEGCNEITLSIGKGSYAEQYAKNNGIAYVLIN